VIFHSEAQVNYIVRCLADMINDRLGALECREESCDDYNRRVDAAHSQMVWSHPGMNNWYKNRAGRVVSISPWRLVDYWHMTRNPDLTDYIATPRFVDAEAD